MSNRLFVSRRHQLRGRYQARPFRSKPKKVLEYRQDKMTSRRRSFFVSGGTLPRNSASYIERKADKFLFESLLAGQYCYVLNPRQVGKSSLSVHTIERLDEVGVRTAFVDLSRIGGRNVTAEQWYFGLAFEIARELDRLREATLYWKANSALSPIQRLFGLIHEVALLDLSMPEPLVVFIDEIDATRSLPFEADEFFAGIRECFNRRVHEPAFERLTFCLLGVAVPSDLISDRTTTPFNIGERVTLDDFTLEELSSFAEELGPKGKEVLARVHYWTNGHPFLSQSICRSIADLDGTPDRKVVDEVVVRLLFDHAARDTNINLSDVANIALHYGESSENPGEFRADVLSLYQRVLANKDVPDDDSNRAVVRLRLSGIVRTERGRLRIRNRIYETVFDRTWIEEHMPEQELRRQIHSYRRGVWRAALVSGAMLLAIGSFAVVAWRSRIAALDAETRLNYELYVSDMNRLRTLYENGDAGSVENILNLHRHSPYRGFEWGFWLGRYHDSNEEYTLAYKAPGKRMDAHISTDGREVCLIDSLANITVIVDRATKRAVAQAPYSDPRLVMSTQSRWVKIEDVNHRRYRVIELKTGRIVSTLGEANRATQWVYPVDHSNFAVTCEATLEPKPSYFINVWDVETGKKVFGYANPWAGGFSAHSRDGDLIALSRDGRYLVGLRGPLGQDPNVPNALQGEVIVTDLTTRKIVDRFITNDYAQVVGPGFAGSTFFFTNRDNSFIRDVAGHRTIRWEPQTIRDWQVTDAAICGDTLVTLINGGRCVVRDLTGKRQDQVRENVFSIGAGADNGQYLASSNSVRFYEASQSDGETEIPGYRVTRYDDGTLNIFLRAKPGIRRVREADLGDVSTVPAPGESQFQTYTGRWYLTSGSGGALPTLTQSGSSDPIPLPFSPTMWSGAIGPNSIALYRGATRELMAYSGRERRIRWRRNDVKDVNSVWVAPNGDSVYVASGRSIDVYSMADGKRLGLLDSHNVGPLNLSFSRDSRFAFTCGGDGRAVMWDVARLKKVMEFRGNEQQAVTCADLSPDGRRVVTTNRSGAWQLWDATTGVQLLDIRVSASALSSAIFCADGNRIITGGDDGRIRVWRAVESDPTTYIPLDPNLLSKLHP